MLRGAIDAVSAPQPNRQAAITGADNLPGRDDPNPLRRWALRSNLPLHAQHRGELPHVGYDSPHFISREPLLAVPRRVEDRSDPLHKL